MFYIKDPSSLGKPWILSKSEEKEPFCIPEDVTRVMKNYHILAVEFLYHNYRKGMKGSILNEENEMNFPLQISAFLRAILRGNETVLIICANQSLCSWHYCLSIYGNFTIKKITQKNCNTDFNSDNRLALLLELRDVNLCKNLKNLNCFSVVIENFDSIANKMVIQEIKGQFNIGLTLRSFYTDPDQRLQWKMLNWCNPGCVGKLNDFYEIDNDNFENFRDSYRFWWFRLTWNFCDSFKRPTKDELTSYEEILKKWGDDNSLNYTGKSRKRKAIEEDVVPPKIAQKFDAELNSESSSDTIINEVPIDKYVKLPSMDESPILTSIIRNFETSPEPTRYYPSSYSYEPFSYSLSEPNCSKNYLEDNSIILSFIDNNDKPCTSKYNPGDSIINRAKSEDTEETEKKKQNLNDEIEDILKEADALLQT